MLNRNNLFVHKSSIDENQYIRIACETDSQGNPIQYSMECNLIDQVGFDLGENPRTFTLKGNYLITKNAIQWNIEKYLSSSDNNLNSTIDLFISTCTNALALEYESDQEKLSDILNNLVDIVGVDTQTTHFLNALNNNEFVYNGELTDSQFLGFTNFVNGSVGSPSAFNNFWAIE